MDDLRARLARHKALGNAPQVEHDWLIGHGELRHVDVDEVVVAKGESSTNLNVVLDGHLVIRVDRGAGAHKVFEWRGGDVAGAMPYSRGAVPPGDVVAEEPTDMISIPRELFPEITRECPVITGTLVHAMVDRARQFTSSDLRDEKLVSLGKLAAGLAHELNNPAAAVVRSAKSLSGSLTAAEHAARQLARTGLTDAQFSVIESMRAGCVASREEKQLSALERADREEQIAGWLDDHKVNVDAAPALADSGVTVDSLDTLANAVSAAALDGTIQWIAACCGVRALSSEIETAATRISDLVGAVKGFSYMDRAPTPEAVDIRKGITDTITMLGAKLRSKSIGLTVDFDEGLSRAHAVGAELNQVWMNLIDNALDAAPQDGHVHVRAANDRSCIIVSITDDGAGISEDIRNRIFDPFFTTKGVGKGTGLGLDVVRRLLQRQEGEISVESRPGHTEFQVRLPGAK